LIDFGSAIDPLDASAKEFLKLQFKQKLGEVKNDAKEFWNPADLLLNMKVIKSLSKDAATGLVDSIEKETNRENLKEFLRSLFNTKTLDEKQFAQELTGLKPAYFQDLLSLLTTIIN
jgi:hypothetical protein